MQSSHRNIAIAAFCAAHFLALALLEFARRADEGWPSLIGRIFIMSQFALLATWLGLGKAPRRLGKTMLLLFAAALIERVGEGNLSSGGGLVGAVLAAIFGALPLILVALPWAEVRRRGYELIDLNESPPQGGEIGFQFSLRQAFIWTALAALVFATAQWMPRLGTMDGNEIRPSSPWFGLLLTLGLVLQFFVVMLLAGWAALTPGDCRPRIAIVLVIAVLFGPLPPYFFRGGTRQYAVFTGTWLGYASLLSASLLFFRACGYRLVRVVPRR